MDIGSGTRLICVIASVIKNKFMMNEKDKHLKDYLLKRKLELSADALDASILSNLLVTNKNNSVMHYMNEIFKAAAWIDRRVHNECKSFRDDDGCEYEFDYLLDGFYEASFYDEGELFQDCIICESEYQKIIIGLIPLDK